MQIPSIPVSAGDLWGNLAGDDEEIEVLDQCFVDNVELFGTFRSSSVPLRIVRSRKGMGKSALLRKVAHEKRGPDLLSARTNLDEGARWEIHHCFRRHLRISDTPLA
jgi:hypothetical protein